MALDPRIILAGQPVNALGAMAQGTQIAQATNQARQQNRLAELYRQQGAGILAGEQGALNALAGIDPMAALGVQQTQQTMARLSEADRRAAEEFAATRSQAEKDAAAARIESSVKMGLAAQSPAEWDAIMSRANPDYVGMFDQRNALANQYMEVADILKGQQPQKPADEYQRYVQEEMAAGRQPLTRIEFAQAKKGTEIIYGPDGQPILQRGPGGMKAFTEGQSKDVVYSTRARGALEALEPVANALTSRADIAAEFVPMGLARGFQSEDFQVAQQAGTEFLQAILRKDTGAAITQQETDSYGKTYLPQPGDGPEVLNAKRDARVRAINALEAGMGPAQMLARDRALIKAAEESESTEIDQDGQDIYQSFETFSASPSVQEAAKNAGTTPEAMWQIYQQQQGQ